MTLLEQAAQHLQTQQYNAAAQCYRQLLQAQPQHGQAWYGLGYIAQAQQHWPDAITNFQQACQFLPQQPAPLLGLANAFNQVFIESDALTVLEYAQQQIDNEQINYALMQQYLIMGDITKAKAIISDLLSSRDDTLFAFVSLDAVKVDRHLLVEQQIQRCRDLIRIETAYEPATATTSINHSTKPRANVTMLIRLHYTLGLVAKHHHDYVNAIHHWESANKLQSSLTDFSVTDMSSFFAALLAQDLAQGPAPESAQTHNHKDTNVSLALPIDFTPIFIVGLPRTGSSMLDAQLCALANDSNVTDATDAIASVGEVDYISRHCVSYLAEQTGEPYPLCMSLLTTAMIKEARQRYIDAIALHRLDADFIIDKLPANFQSLPIIFSLFPEAKVLHMRREQAATALSIYSNDFAQAEPYFCDLQQMQVYFGWYEQIMQHFESWYEDKIYSLTYEQFVNAPQSELHKICHYIGMNPVQNSIKQEAVKPPHIIKTLSAVQARQPIYQSSSMVPEALLEYFSFTKT